MSAHLNTASFESHSHYKLTQSQHNTEQKLEFSFNPHGVNKDFDKQVLTKRFERTEGTISDIADRVKLGNAFCSGNLVRLLDVSRGNKSFGDSQILWLDFDNSIDDGHGGKLYCEQITIDQALNNPFVKSYASLIYTTASHKDEWNKFRILFVLPEKVTIRRVCKSLIKKLMTAFPGADKACSDPCRVFYGNTNAEIPLLNQGVTLPREWVDSVDVEIEARIDNVSEHKDGFTIQTITKPSGEVNGFDGMGRMLTASLNPTPMSFNEWRDCLFAFHHAKLSRHEALSWSTLSAKHNDSGFDEVWDNIKGSDKPLTVFTLLRRYDKTAPSATDSTSLSKAEKQVLETQKRVEAFNRKCKDDWLKSHAYTPDITREDKYLDSNLISELMNKYEIVSGKAPMGQGKTTATSAYFKGVDTGVVMSGSRNNLLMQTVCDFNKGADNKFYHLNEAKDDLLLADKCLRVASCVDSNWKYKDSDFDGKILLLDEAVSHELHLLLSSTVAKRGRRNVFKKFEEAVRRSARILMLDGNMRDATVEYIRKIRGCSKDSVIKFENIYPITPLDIRVVSASNDETHHESVIRKSISSPVIANLIETAVNNRLLPDTSCKALVFISDNRGLCERLDRILSKKGVKTWRIDRITSGKKEEKENIASPNEYILDNKIEVLIMSPSVAEGFNVNLENYFSKGYALFFGLIGTDTQMQFIRRVRHCYKWDVWCTDFWRNNCEDVNSYYAKDLQKLINENITFTLTDIYGENSSDLISVQYKKQIDESLDDIHVKRSIDLTVRLNYERHASKECLIYALKKAGHNVTESTELRDLEVEAVLKETKKEIDVESSERIFNAEDLSDEQYRTLKEKLDRTQDEYDACSKAYYKKLLPGIENTNIWTPETLEKLENRKINVKAVERYWLIKNLSIALDIKRDDLKKQIAYETTSSDASLNGTTMSWTKEFRIKNIFIPDIESDFSQLKALQEIGMLEIIHSDTPLSADSDLILNAMKKIKHSKKHQALLGKKAEKTSPMQYISRQAEKLGVKMHSVGTKGSRKNTERTYLFTTPDKMEDISDIYECIDNKFRVKSEGLDRDEKLYFPKQYSITQYVETREAKGDYRESFNFFSIPQGVSEVTRKDVTDIVSAALSEEDENVKIEWLGSVGMILAHEKQSCQEQNTECVDFQLN